MEVLPREKLPTQNPQDCSQAGAQEHTLLLSYFKWVLSKCFPEQSTQDSPDTQRPRAGAVPGACLCEVDCGQPRIFFPLTTNLEDLGNLLGQHLQNGLGMRPVQSHTVGSLSAYQDTSVEAGV